jgi:Cu/Ag efflux pump CusA
MFPIAIGLGTADPSFRSPMAIAVIGGLVTSTVLSLLVVPVVFEYIDDTEQFLRRQAVRFRRLSKSRAVAAEPSVDH